MSEQEQATEPRRCKISIYTDGSCLKNPGPGGWAATLLLEGTEKRLELGGGFSGTTNNRMEITGVIQGLSVLNRPCDVTIYSDSQYVCNAIEKGWLKSWVESNWKGGAVKNIDLWKKLLPLLEVHRVKFVWIRGHDGQVENERCDRRARSWAQKPGNPKDVQQ